MFQWRVQQGDLVGRLGLALAHPLYILAGQLLNSIPLGATAGKLNFLSGIGMAVAAANLACVISLLTGNRWIGALIASILAVTHTAWWLSTIAEVYTWTVAGLTGELWLLVLLFRRPRWQYLAGLGLVSGLGLCVHNFALLPLPVYFGVAIVLVARKELPVWALAVAAATWLAGAGLYLGMTVHMALESGDWAAAIRSALFGEYTEQVLNVAASSKHMKANMALTGLNFLSILTPLAVIGWFKLTRRVGKGLGIAIGAITLIEILFFIRYPVPDQFTFLLPTLTMIAVSAGVGLYAWASISTKARTTAIIACLVSLTAQPALYAVAPTLAEKANVAPRRARKLPYRNEARYWLVPWKHNEKSAQRFAQEALTQASPNGIILTDSTSCNALLVLQQSMSGFEDVWIPNTSRPIPSYNKSPEDFRKAVGNRKLYLAAKGIAGLEGLQQATREAPSTSGPLIEITWE